MDFTLNNNRRSSNTSNCTYSYTITSDSGGPTKTTLVGSSNIVPLSNNIHNHSTITTTTATVVVAATSDTHPVADLTSVAYLGKVNQKTFETSLSEIYQYKQCISVRIKQLEQAISRLKSLILVYGSESDQESTSGNYSSQSVMGKNRFVAAHSNCSGSSESSFDVGGHDQENYHANMSTRSTPSHVDLLELRTILSDIDLHLAVLKDVEERHALICESYSQEIRVRDETLQTKAHQIQTMSLELAELQSKIIQLTIKNQQFESEIKQIKVSDSIFVTSILNLCY